MQTLRQAVVVFCMACISAELLTALVGSARAGRCIKAVAGLYILAVLLAFLPGIPAALRALLSQTAVSAPETPVIALAEEQILARAEEQLAQQCADRCRQQFGMDIHLAIVLEPVGQETAVTQVTVTFPPGCDTAAKESILSGLQQELGVAPTAREELIP